MRISDWSSDVCSSDLQAPAGNDPARLDPVAIAHAKGLFAGLAGADPKDVGRCRVDRVDHRILLLRLPEAVAPSGELKTRRQREDLLRARSEEHTSELQSLMRISYAVFCLKNKTNKKTH